MKLTRRIPRLRLPKALLAQSDFELRSSFGHALERAAFEVTECMSASEFLRRIESSSDYDLIVCDFSWLDAIDVLGGLARGGRQPPLVLVDARNDVTDERLKELRPTVVVRQPFNLMKSVALFRVIASARDRGQEDVTAEVN